MQLEFDFSSTEQKCKIIRFPGHVAARRIWKGWFIDAVEAYEEAAPKKKAGIKVGIAHQLAIAMRKDGATESEIATAQRECLAEVMAEVWRRQRNGPLAG